MLAVLRIWGPHLDLDGSLQRLPHESVQKVWRVGDMGRRGKVNTSSGFTLLLSESDSEQEVVSDTATALVRIAAPLAELIRGGASAQVDIAFFVTASEPRSISFGASILRAMSQAEVEVTVSAYPTSEREDAE